MHIFQNFFSLILCLIKKLNKENRKLTKKSLFSTFSYTFRLSLNYCFSYPVSNMWSVWSFLDHLTV